MSENPSIHVHCPFCNHANALRQETLPKRVRDFSTFSFPCHKCQRWLRLDFLVGPSLLGMEEDEKEKAEEPPERPIGLRLP